MTKRGGALPFLPMLDALVSLIGGAASVTKAVNDSKATRRQLEELQRHDREIEQGRELYLTAQIRTVSQLLQTRCSSKEKKTPKR